MSGVIFAILSYVYMTRLITLDDLGVLFGFAR